MVDASFSFDVCENRSCVNINIIDDAVDEAHEFFTISLTRPAVLDTRFDLDPVDGLIFIVDNDDGK